MLLISNKYLDLLGLKINTLRASNWLNTFYLGRKNQQRRKRTACSATHTVMACLLRHWTGRMKDGIFKRPFHWSGTYILSCSTRGLFWRSLWKAVSLSGSLFKECRWSSFWNSGDKISSALSGKSLSMKILRNCVLLSYIPGMTCYPKDYSVTFSSWERFYLSDLFLIDRFLFISTCRFCWFSTSHRSMFPNPGPGEPSTVHILDVSLIKHTRFNSSTH